MSYVIGFCFEVDKSARVGPSDVYPVSNLVSRALPRIVIGFSGIPWQTQPNGDSLSHVRQLVNYLKTVETIISGA